MKKIKKLFMIAGMAVLLQSCGVSMTLTLEPDYRYHYRYYPADKHSYDYYRSYHRGTYEYYRGYYGGYYYYLPIKKYYRRYRYHRSRHYYYRYRR